MYHNLWLCGSQQTGKFLKRWEYQTILPASCETCKQVKKQQLELDMEQQNIWNNMVSNRERSMSRLYVVTQFI